MKNLKIFGCVCVKLWYEVDTFSIVVISGLLFATMWFLVWPVPFVTSLDGFPSYMMSWVMHLVATYMGALMVILCFLIITILCESISEKSTYWWWKLKWTWKDCKAEYEKRSGKDAI